MITSFFGAYRFLSNFYPSPITYEGILYPTVEHAFQAAKTLDVNERESVSKLEEPNQAKKIGKILDLREDWQLIKTDIMEELLRLKFADSNLMQLLKNTQPHELIEGNTWNDRIWGCVLVNGKWIGQNRLGKLLMKIRDE